MDEHTTVFPPRTLVKPPRKAKRARPAVNGNGNGRATSASLPSEHVDERKLLEVLTALRKGNFNPRLPVKWTGMAGKVADTVNDVMELNQRLAKELERLSRMV